MVWISVSGGASQGIGECCVVELVDFPNEGLPRGVKPATGWSFTRDLREGHVRLDLSHRV